MKKLMMILCALLGMASASAADTDHSNNLLFEWFPRSNAFSVRFADSIDSAHAYETEPLGPIIPTRNAYGNLPLLSSMVTLGHWGRLPLQDDLELLIDYCGNEEKAANFLYTYMTGKNRARVIGDSAENPHSFWASQLGQRLVKIYGVPLDAVDVGNRVRRRSCARGGGNHPDYIVVRVAPVSGA